MSAAKQNITIEKGATFRMTIRWVDSLGVAIPLTGYIARMHVRLTVDAADPPLLNLTSGGGEITIDAPNGILTIKVSATVTAGLTFTDGVYDLEVESPTGEVDRLVQGSVLVSPEVTR